MLGKYLCTCSRPQRELDFSQAHSKNCIRPQCNRLLTPLYSCPFHQHAWKYLASKPCMPRSATACSHDPEHSNPKFFYFSFRKLARNRTKLILEAVKIKLAAVLFLGTPKLWMEEKGVHGRIEEKMVGWGRGKRMHLVAGNVWMVLLLEFPVSVLDFLRCGMNCDTQHLVVIIPGPSPCCAAAPDHTSWSVMVWSYQFMVNWSISWQQMTVIRCSRGAEEPYHFCMDCGDSFCLWFFPATGDSSVQIFPYSCPFHRVDICRNFLNFCTKKK